MQCMIIIFTTGFAFLQNGDHVLHHPKMFNLQNIRPIKFMFKTCLSQELKVSDRSMMQGLDSDGVQLFDLEVTLTLMRINKLGI